MDRYDGLRLENQLCFPLYAASREIIKLYRPYLDKLDLTYTQYIAMMVLWQEETISVRDLGSRLYLDSGTLTPVLKSLEEKGYVTRCRSQTDQRVLDVSITAAGRSLRAQAAEIPAQVGRCIRLEPERAKDLYKTLYQILEGLRP